MTALLNRLTLANKFMLLGVMVLVLFGIPTWLFVNQVNESVDFAKQETKGATYLADVMNFLQRVQQHRGLSNLVLNGKNEARTQWEEKRKEADESVSAVDADNARHPELGLDKDWKPIKEKWHALKSEVSGLTPQDSFQRHTALVDMITKFITTTGDASNITYDPTIDGYQLGQLATARLPTLTEYMGRMRAWGASVLAQKKATPDERSRLTMYAGLAQREIESSADTLEKTYGANEALKQQLDALFRAAELKSGVALKLAQEHIVNADTFAFASQDYFAAMTEAIDAQFMLVHAVNEQLAASLQAQTDRLNARKYSLLTAVLMLFALCAVVGVFVARNVARPASFVAETLDRVASGDLTVSIPETIGRDELATMQRSLRNMVDILSRTITQVRGSADALSSASEEVSATAQSLSQSSSEQSSSVEETSASVEQMTASINQNSENSKVTDGMASKAAKEATEGGSAVKETVEAMKSIAEKISIIDDIAYQTNLLALNAAIEAARAGEHGKGFAVVAAEVRKLAERSQVAAQEIGEVAKGSVHLAEKAGKLLDEMVPSIKKTSDLVQEITAASEEQSSGVGQINTAMSQLNQLTQQNASASEELAATAEEMSGQSQQLQQLMSFFKVEHGAMAQHTATSKAARKVRTQTAAAAALPQVAGAEPSDAEFVKF